MFRTRTGTEAPAKSKTARGSWLVSLAACLCSLSGVAGGMLWSLSPLGARLSAEVLRAPDFFWRLFPAAPLAMLFGLVGMLLYSRGDALVRVGFAVASLGAVLVISGDIALYILKLDDTFIMSAPSYLTLRAGLLVFTFGTLVFGFLLARSRTHLRTVPLVGTIPLMIGALAGGISVTGDFGMLGAGMWVAFGVAFAWCSLVLSVVATVSFFRERKARATKV